MQYYIIFNILEVGSSICPPVGGLLDDRALLRSWRINQINRINRLL